VRLSPLGTSAAIYSYSPAPDDTMMMMIVEQSVEWELAGESEVLGGNLPQCHIVHHKSHMAWPELEPGSSLWEAGD
jgi:hypothetical protein